MDEDEGTRGAAASNDCLLRCSADKWTVLGIFHTFPNSMSCVGGNAIVCHPRPPLYEARVDAMTSPAVKNRLRSIVQSSAPGLMGDLRAMNLIPTNKAATNQKVMETATPVLPLGLRPTCSIGTCPPGYIEADIVVLETEQIAGISSRQTLVFCGQYQPVELPPEKGATQPRLLGSHVPLASAYSPKKLWTLECHNVYC